MKLFQCFAVILLFFLEPSRSAEKPTAPEVHLDSWDDFSARLAGEYFILRTSRDQVEVSPLSWDDSTPRIAAKVVECGADKRFVIAKRQLMKRRGLRPDDDFQIPVAGSFDYWILDAVAPKVFGPYTLEEFNNKRKELRIPESIALKDINSFRPKTGAKPAN